MPVSQADAEYVREIVYRRSAILIDQAKHYLIEMRLEQLAKDRGLPGVDALLSQARSSSGLLESSIVEAITTHETSFFRDIQPFDILKQDLLPRLIAAKAASRTLNIWCGACSSGQEPYSIAMMIHEHFPSLANWPIQIIATDISAQILARAKEGKFKQLEVNRGLPAAYLVKYFERQGTEWVVKPAVRKLVRFEQLNLLDRYSFYPAPDVIFLRNVLIYFDVPTKRSILERIRTTIAPGGALLLGSAETTLGISDAWERVSSQNSAYYRVQS
jgi:chemotaxis protein methyltransferase CheR